MILLDLFAGIGGFSLAADWTWDNVTHTFVEKDKFCQRVIRKHWPHSQIHDDITTYKHDGTVVDLLTGGFPCQPFSIAGKRKGKEDDRHLWPEMLRVIRESNPRWIVGENVGGLIGMAQQDGDAEMESEADYASGSYDESEARGLLYEIIGGVEQEGYSVQPFVIPACAVNAPHRRDRIWIVAHNRSYEPQVVIAHASSDLRRTSGDGKFETPDGADNPSNATFANSKREGLQEPESREFVKPPFDVKRDGPSRHAHNTERERLERYANTRDHEEGRPDEGGPMFETGWGSHWLEVATGLCRVDARVPDRVDRLRALGNSIVPQVAQQIFEAIKRIEG